MDPTQQRVRRGPLQFRKILVPLDFSEASRLGLDYALGFAQEFHATVVLFHSIFVSAYVMGNRYNAHYVPTLIANQQECARREMEEARAAISRKGGMAEVKIAVGQAVEQVTRYMSAKRGST